MKKVEKYFRLLAFGIALGMAGFSSWTASADGAGPIPSPAPVAGGGEGLSLLMIGDSHTVGMFGHTVDKFLRASYPAAKVSVYGASSATPEYYFQGSSSHGGYFQHPAVGPILGSSPGAVDAPTPKLSGLLDKWHPTYTIVALSTNYLAGSLDGVKPQIVKTIQALKDKGSKCIWVSGPDERFVPREKIEALYQIIHAVTVDMGCPLIDSRKYTHYPPQGGDSRHYDGINVTSANGTSVNIGIPMAKEWGSRVAADILEIIAGSSELASHH